MIDLSIEFLMYTIVVALFLLGSILSYLGSKSIQLVHKNKKIEEYVTIQQDQWYDVLLNKSPFSVTLIPKRTNEIEAVERILLSYIHHISDQQIIERIERFSNQYLFKHYQSLLKVSNWSTRMNALYRVIDFRIDRLLADCIQLEDQKKVSKDEYFLLLIIYSLFDKQRFIEKVLSNELNFSVYQYKKLFTSIEETVLTEIRHHYFAELEDNGKYALIDIIAFKRNWNDLIWLESQLQQAEPEIRIRSLKAMNEIGILGESQSYLRFVDSKIWQERLMVAKLLQYLPFEEAMPYLNQLIQDESFVVRAQAAETFSKSEDGRNYLAEVDARLKDPYAIDIAREYMLKGS
ncbi:HEAT repeat domain-containing protein [Gracilibacillus massiliensis]|uniref:HEAT repeat domain-containing protein n=1 Tax=Gracilibacillus massiliensis TaxID=1564956 RepID=UPI00071E5A48|nr:HEAT repeat domain-containing protein [Gracilibacillus massiliensis]